jgi:hypothetical protein
MNRRQFIRSIIGTVSLTVLLPILPAAPKKPRLIGKNVRIYLEDSEGVQREIAADVGECKVCALSRPGVTLTSVQDQQIEVRYEAGDLLGVQRIILAELGNQLDG